MYYYMLCTDTVFISVVMPLGTPGVFFSCLLLRGIIQKHAQLWKSIICAHIHISCGMYSIHFTYIHLIYLNVDWELLCFLQYKVIWHVCIFLQLEKIIVSEHVHYLRLPWCFTNNIETFGCFFPQMLLICLRIWEKKSCIDF